MTVHACAVCGRALPASPDPGRPRVYCSTACRREREATLSRIRVRIGDLEEERARYERESASGMTETIGVRGRLVLADALASVEAAIQREFARIAALSDES